MTELKYAEGQRVWVYGHNIKSPVEATVKKVGRKLVTTTEGRYGRERTFRIDTGVANDAYGHEWIKTDDEKLRDERAAELNVQLRSFGLEIRLGRNLRLEVLEAVVKALDDSSQTDQNSVAGTTTLSLSESG